MSEFQELLNEQLQDNKFRKEWEDIQPEMDVIRAMADARKLLKRLAGEPGQEESGRQPYRKAELSAG